MLNAQKARHLYGREEGNDNWKIFTFHLYHNVKEGERVN